MLRVRMVVSVMLGVLVVSLCGSVNAQTGTNVTVSLVALDAPSTVDEAAQLPVPASQFLVGDTVFVELWAQTMDPNGFSMVSTDISYDPSALSASSVITHTALFSLFPSGAVDNVAGAADNVSGSVNPVGPPPCSSAVGASPKWARVAVLEMQANAPGVHNVLSGPANDIVFVIANCGSPNAPVVTFVDASITVLSAASPPLAVSGYPHEVSKNRYISFSPNPANIGIPHTYRVTHVSGGTDCVTGPNCCNGDSCFFISTPRTTPAEIAGQGYTYVVSDTDAVAGGLLFDFSSTVPVIQVGGCLLASGETYEVQTTSDGVNFSAPLTVNTAAIPTNGRFWGDAVGVFSAAGDMTTLPPTPAGAWTPPNSTMNGFDVTAAINGFRKLNQPDNTWTDVNGVGLDRLTNGNDVLRFVNAFSTGTGREFYPFPAPGTCSAGPGLDIPPQAELDP